MKYENLYEELVNLVKKSGSLFIESYNKTISSELIISEELFICGMGGSAIGGDYVQMINEIESSSKNLISTIREYSLPNRVKSGSQVIVVSYSGNTEESLMMLNQLLNMKIKPIIITSGGKMNDIARENRLDIVQIMKDLQPRAAFPLIFGSLYGMISRAIRLPLLTENQKSQIIKQSQETSIGTIEQSNKIIDAIYDNFPVIVSSIVLAPVATRFRCQLNENSKISAASFIVPEFSHNAIVGFDGTRNKTLVLIILRSSIEHKRVGLQLDFIRDNVSAADVIEIIPNSETYLGELLELTWKLDYISILAAKKQNIDPIIVRSIDSLKKTLDKTNPS